MFADPLFRHKPRRLPDIFRTSSPGAQAQSGTTAPAGCARAAAPPPLDASRGQMDGPLREPIGMEFLLPSPQPKIRFPLIGKDRWFGA